MTNMRKWNYIIAVVVAVLGAAVIAVNSKFEIEFGVGDPGAGFWPTMLGGLLILLAILLVVMTTKNKAKEETKTFTMTLPQNMLVYKFMALTVGFCVVMYIFGLLIAALLFIPICSYMLGGRGKAVIILDVVFVLVLYVAFVELLHTPLPEPIWLR